MDATYLTKIVEDVVLKVLEDNPVRFVAALTKSLDWSEENGLELVHQLQKKMTPHTSAAAAINSATALNEAELRVAQLIKDLKGSSLNVRRTVRDEFGDVGLATEDFAKNVAREEAEEVVEDKMGEYCDEDAVRELINGAWNGA